MQKSYSCSVFVWFLTTVVFFKNDNSNSYYGPKTFLQLWVGKEDDTSKMLTEDKTDIKILIAFNITNVNKASWLYKQSTSKNCKF